MSRCRNPRGYIKPINKQKFVENHHSLLAEIFKAEGKNPECEKVILNLARSELGYSKNTVNQDIMRALHNTFMKS